MKPKLTLPERERILKRVLLDKEPVARVCRETGISRVLLYRWLSRYQDKLHFRRIGKSTKPATYIEAAVMPRKGAILHKPHYSTRLRIQAVQEVISQKKSVAEVCRELNISRTIFYRWLKRYKEAGNDIGKDVILVSRNAVKAHPESLPVNTTGTDSGVASLPRMTSVISKSTFNEHAAISALEDKKPFIERYGNQVEDKYEQLILDAVAHYPELSSHKLVQMLPMIGNRPIVGNHGVQNVLRRHDLRTYEQRFQFAQKYQQPSPMVTTFIRPVISALLSLIKLPLRTQNRIVAGVIAFLIPLTAAIILFGSVSYIRLLVEAPSLGISLGYLFSSIALVFGFLFFLYSLKYYLSVATVLLFSRKTLVKEQDTITRIPMNSGFNNALIPDVSNITLTRKPFISIHLPLYNERRVVNRLLEAVTAMDYDNYEVIICDDSTDETKDIVKEWRRHPRIKISHRDNRAGYKGGALSQALRLMDRRTEFVLVFDADFLPYPDTIEQFLKYFQATCGTLDINLLNSAGRPETAAAVEGPHFPTGDPIGRSRSLQDDINSDIAAIQGYQWHVLNKSENFITRGVRSEYAGSYVIERSGAEIYGGLKQIAGSVYMIRADLLRRFGWGNSITEDFELTLRLYAAGYKVVYTPYIQSPSECVSTLKRLVRQRMRWAEGHSFNIKKMFGQLLLSPRPTFMEKLEFLYLSPYYLQSFFFLFGTFCWFLSEAVLRVKLPFWTDVWGWSLVLTNMLSLPLMNLVGMFLEEAEEKDYLGLFSFVILTYILTPFQAFAAVKGFLENEEGPWFRTPKTGHITDVFRRGRFYRWLSGIFPSAASATEGTLSQVHGAISISRLAFSSETQQTGKFIRRGRVTWIGKAILAILLSITTTLLYFSRNVNMAYATDITGPLKLSLGNDGSGGTWPAWGNFLTNSTSYDATGVNFLFSRNGANSTTNNYAWYSVLLPTGWASGGSDASIPAGAYYLQIGKVNGGAGVQTINFGVQLLLTNNNGTSRAQMLGNVFQIRTDNVNNASFQYLIGTKGAANAITRTAPNRLSLRVYWINASNGRANIRWLINYNTAPGRLVIPANITVPEMQTVIFVVLIVIMPILPSLVTGPPLKRRKDIFKEIAYAWIDLLKKLTGQGEEALDQLPV